MCVSGLRLWMWSPELHYGPNSSRYELVACKHCLAALHQGLGSWVVGLHNSWTLTLSTFREGLQMKKIMTRLFLGNGCWDGFSGFHYVVINWTVYLQFVYFSMYSSIKENVKDTFFTIQSSLAINLFKLCLYHCLLGNYLVAVSILWIIKC